MFKFQGTTVDVDEVAALEFREIAANGKIYAYATLRSGHVVTMEGESQEDLMEFQALQQLVTEAIQVRNVQNRTVVVNDPGVNFLTQPLINLGSSSINQPLMPPGSHG